MDPKRPEDEEENEILADRDDPVDIEGFEEDKNEPINWDKKARLVMRQIVTQKVDLPISRLRQMIDDAEIVLAPEFQRRHRWSRAQQSRLIESVMMNVPIPPVFLGEDEPGKYVVLDGRQRLTALYQYLNNLYKLSGLQVWDELNGKTFKQLQQKSDASYASAITRRFVPAVLILHESVPEVKYEVFERLNTGGVIAEPMEVRNAIYRGEFNRLLHEVTRNMEFCNLWGIPTDGPQRHRNGSYRRMADLEMALRFFAFQDYRRFSGSLKLFLNEFMAKRNAEYAKRPDLYEQDRVLFVTTMKKTVALFGPDAFHRIMNGGRRSPIPSAPLADAILYAVSSLPEIVLERNCGNVIKEALDNLIREDREFETAITVGTNARTATEYRIETASRILKDAMRKFTTGGGETGNA